MRDDVVKVSVKGVMPTQNGCAVFLGNDDKTYVIYVDQAIGNAITMSMNDVKKERPLTHDLILSIFSGLNVEVDRIVVNHFDEGTFYARIILKMENELGMKIVELDARPSDSIVIALQADRPIYTTREVFDNMEDMTEILQKILKQKP